jgi:hypothetical protein
MSYISPKKSGRQANGHSARSDRFPVLFFLSNGSRLGMNLTTIGYVGGGVIHPAKYIARFSSGPETYSSVYPCPKFI